MRNRRLLLTTLVVLLSGLAPLSYAAQRLVNLDFAAHTPALPGCAGTAPNSTVGAYDLTVDDPANTDETGVGATDYIGNVPGTTNFGCVPGGTFITGYGTTSGDARTVFAAMTSGIIDSNETAGRTIATEILQGGVDLIPSGKDADDKFTPKYLGLMYIVDGDIAKNAIVTFTLSDGTFAEDPWFAVSQGDGGSDFGGWGKVAGTGSGKNTAQYKLPTEATRIGQNAIDGTDKSPALFFLLYQVEGAASLQTGGEVTMSIDVKTDEATQVQLGSGQVTILKSVSALSAEMTSENKGDVYISVNDDSKLLTDNDENALPEDAYEETAFRDTSTARIGYITLGGEPVFEDDGVTLFTIGAGRGEVDDASSEFVIEGGQFAASKQGSGLVRLWGVNEDGTGGLIASTVASDDNKVVFNSTTTGIDINTMLSDMSNYDRVAIEFVVDTVNTINLVDAAPTGSLTLSFANGITLDGTVADALQGVPLRQIFQNGTVCWAYNVPYATVQDKFNIRITNQSSVAGSISATMYSADGVKGETKELETTTYTNPDTGTETEVLTELKSEKDLGMGTDEVRNLLPPKHTLHLNSEKLSALIGEWQGRAVVRFVSELPSMEMLALLRNQLMDESSQPLNNLSLGAHGQSCVQGQ